MARAKRDVGGKREPMTVEYVCFVSKCKRMNSDVGASEALFWSHTQVCDTSARAGPMRGEACVAIRPKMRGVFFF